MVGGKSLSAKAVLTLPETHKYICTFQSSTTQSKFKFSSNGIVLSIALQIYPTICMLFLYSFKNHFCQSHTTSQLIELDPSVVKAGLAKPRLLQELISISETNRLIETANQVWSLGRISLHNLVRRVKSSVHRWTRSKIPEGVWFLFLKEGCKFFCQGRLPLQPQKDLACDTRYFLK